MTGRTSRTMTNRLAADVDAAFPSMVAAHIDGIYSGIRRLVPTAADAEDLTQETFIRAYRALTRYEPARIEDLRLRAWLWTIAVNLCRSAARKRGRRVGEVALDADHDTPIAASTEPEAIEAAMEAEWARRLARLTEAQRTAVILRHIADLPYAEIATITGRPVGTVKADVHRGIERLRRDLSGDTRQFQEERT